MKLRYKLANWLTRGELETLRSDYRGATEALTASRDARALMKSRIANLEKDFASLAMKADRFGRALCSIRDITSSGRAPNGTVKRIGRIASETLDGGAPVRVKQ